MELFKAGHAHRAVRRPGALQAACISVCVGGGVGAVPLNAVAHSVEFMRVLLLPHIVSAGDREMRREQQRQAAPSLLRYVEQLAMLGPESDQQPIQ